MSGRLADINARIETVHKLEAVIKAMRGIAASRVQEASQHLQNVRTYAETIGNGISQVLARVQPSEGGQSGKGRAVIVFTAEQGFAGAFSDRVFDRLVNEIGPDTSLFVVGERGLAEADERGLAVTWSAPMVAQPDQALSLATRLTDTAFEGVASGAFSNLSVLYCEPASGQTNIRLEQLIPFDFARFPHERGAEVMLSLPPEQLLDGLVQEFVFAQLAQAALLSFAAENEARMRAMIAAQDNTAETLAQMVGTARQLRQDDITEEILELAVAALAEG